MFRDWEQVDQDQVLYVLLNVRQLFSNSNTWVYFPSAINAVDLEVLPEEASAVKWNLMGATELYANQAYPKPLADFIAVATREYLNDLSEDLYFKGKLQYHDEFALIELGIEEITNKINEK
jgi:hypothetical protein